MWYTEDTKEKVVGSIGGRQEWNNFMEKEMNREMSCRLNNGGWEEGFFSAEAQCELGKRGMT